MADYNRNRQDAYRQQFGWQDDYRPQQGNYEDEPNYTITENRGYRDGGPYGNTSSDNSGWQSRRERNMTSQREDDYGRHQRPSGYRQNDYGYGTGGRGLSSAYADFGGDYSTRGERNLYDRGDQGINRRDYQNTENRLGGANYGRYGDRGRYDRQDESYRRGQGRSGEGDIGRSSGWSEYGRFDTGYRDRESDRGYRDRYSRNYGSGDMEERSWWDRTTDEVSSWFGDEDAERRRERDRMHGHRGRGPKNYTRSDERITEDINDRLSDDPFIDASDIEVVVNNGEVTLSGHVDHRSSKRRAEDLAESVSGVRNVENRIRVQQASAINSPSGAPASQSTAPIPGADRDRTRETSKTTK